MARRFFRIFAALGVVIVALVVIARAHRASQQHRVAESLALTSAGSIHAAMSFASAALTRRFKFAVKILPRGPMGQRGAGKTYGRKLAEQSSGHELMTDALNLRLTGYESRMSGVNRIAPEYQVVRVFGRGTEHEPRGTVCLNANGAV